jgi:hypothetical protein
MTTPRHTRLPANALLPRGARGGAGRIWIPWIVAPLFMLSPIAGCALGGKIRQGAMVTPPTASTSPPSVTFEDEAPAIGPVPTFAPVVPVAPTAAR